MTPIRKAEDAVRIYPMSVLEIGGGRIDGDRGWWLVEFADGSPGYANGHLAVRGPMPKWAGPSLCKKDLAGAIAKIPGAADLVPCQAVAISEDKSGRQAVWFDCGRAIQALYYEHVLAYWGGVTWKSTREDGAAFAYVGELLVAVVMGLRSEKVLQECLQMTFEELKAKVAG